MPLYALRWESKETNEIFDIAMQSAEKMGVVELAKNTTTWSQMLTS
jgi:uncharacterized membrane protein